MPSCVSHSQIPAWWASDVIVGELLKCFAPLSVDCVLTPALQYSVTNHFCALVLFDCACDMDRESAAHV